MDIQHERDNLLFGVRRSIRYHCRRTQFLDRLGKCITFFTLAAGLATTTTLMAHLDPIWAEVCGGLVGAFAVLNIVIGCNEKARLHNDLAREFIDLEIAFEKTGGALSREQLTEFTTQRLRIEAKEPPILRVLDLQCHNELCRAIGRTDECVSIGPFQRFFAQFMDINLAKLEKGSC